MSPPRTDLAERQPGSSAPPLAQVRPVDPAPEFSGPFWAALLAVSVLSGLAGGLLMRLLYAVQSIAWAEQGRGFYAATLAASPGRKFACLLLAGALVGVGAVALRFLKGGHAGELVEAIWRHDGEMPAAKTLGRAVLSILIVGLGAAVGREGALKQTGAVIGWQAAHRLRLTSEQRRVLTACGAGAGMAAAYNIPLAGAVFALEVLLGSLSWSVAVPALTASVLATAVSWILLPMRMTYATPAYPLSVNLVVFAGLAGPLIGIVALGYVRLIGWTDLHRPKTWTAKLAAPLLVFSGLAAAGLGWPELLGNGKDIVQIAYSGGGQDPRMSFGPMLLSLALARALATAACLRSGAPGGLFTPTLTCGALLGASGGRLWSRLFPGDAPGAYAVVGSAALLAAATGAPVSAIVSVIELGQHTAGLAAAIVLASAGACAVMRFAGAPSIYTVRVRPPDRPAGPQAGPVQPQG